MVLERQGVPGFQVQDFPRVPLVLREDDLAAPGLRPVGNEVAGIGERLAFLVVGQRGVLRNEVAHAGAKCLGFGRQIDCVAAPDALRRETRHVCERAIGAEHRRERARAAHVEVRVVFPGVADAAVHLDVQLTTARERRQRQARRHRARELGLAVLDARARRVPRGRRRLLGARCRAGGAPVA